jgi:hypothetical protein
MRQRESRQQFIQHGLDQAVRQAQLARFHTEDGEHRMAQSRTDIQCFLISVAHCRLPQAEPAERSYQRALSSSTG